MKFFIIGERELVLAFRMAGVTGVEAQTRSEVLNAFKAVTTGGATDNIAISEVPKVLILTESAASLIEEEELEWQKSGKYPLIVEVPSLSGRIQGKKSLTDAIREAVGVQV